MGVPRSCCWSGSVAIDGGKELFWSQQCNYCFFWVAESFSELFNVVWWGELWQFWQGHCGGCGKDPPENCVCITEDQSSQAAVFNLAPDSKEKGY